jgi:hypothetical protein
MTPQDFSEQISMLVTPFISMMIGIIIALWVKDFAASMAKGMSFKLFGPFKEGDKAILDGESCVVVKIGLSMTVFGVQDGDDYIWRYVPNQKIANLKLGKVIISNDKL